MPHFKIYTRKQILSQINLREGEQKLGESIQKVSVENWQLDLKNSDAKYVILGISEDIGVRANGGIGGTHTAWQSFLKSFLNVQSNEFLSSEKILILGVFDFEDWLEQSASLSLIELRALTTQIDNVVAPVINEIVSCGRIPIVIGGGHNNCYPIMKGCSEALGQKINTINHDAHADFRVLEGRHSGNGFHYAMTDNYLNKYAMLGLHESYNNQFIIDSINNNNHLQAIWWEDIFLKNILTWDNALNESISFVSGEKYGVELDIDSIENTLSSALSPVGISATQAMQYVYQSSRHQNVVYLHLPEAVAIRTDGLESHTIGKLLSYLVTAFIKGNRTLG